MRVALRYWSLISLVGFIILGMALAAFNRQLVEEQLLAVEEPLLLAAIEQAQAQFVKTLTLGLAALYLLLLLAARQVVSVISRQQRSLQCTEKAVWEKARQLEQEISARKRAEHALSRVQQKVAASS